MGYMFWPLLLEYLIRGVQTVPSRVSFQLFLPNFALNSDQAPAEHTLHNRLIFTDMPDMTENSFHDGTVQSNVPLKKVRCSKNEKTALSGRHSRSEPSHQS